jgi:hypothetical protein
MAPGDVDGLGQRCQIEALDAHPGVRMDRFATTSIGLGETIPDSLGSRKVGRDNGQQIDPNRAEIAANPRQIPHFSTESRPHRGFTPFCVARENIPKFHDFNAIFARYF